MVGHRFCERLIEYDSERAYRIVVFGEEPRPAYDRVHLTSYLGGKSVEELTLADRDWYSQNQIELHTNVRVTAIERATQHVVTSSGERLPYDYLVLATGSAPFVPRIPGIEKRGVFVYRTI